MKDDLIKGSGNLQPNDERMHHYQRRRTSITELVL
jgi:hypothetical protein